MAHDNTMAAYDAIAPQYAEYSKTKEAYLETVDSLVLDHLKDGMRLLDVGAGDGRRLAKIQSQVQLKDCVAVEPSAEMAKLCKVQAGVDVHDVFAEDLDRLDIGVFGAITALWNVFGHIPSSENRLKALQNMRDKLGPDGIIMLDVNNRHNAVAYGGWNVFQRKLIDTFDFDEGRGDASYDWEINGKTYKGSGHLFTPKEIEKLFKKAGLQIVKRLSVNYADGTVSKSKYRGQLFYILKRAS